MTVLAALLALIGLVALGGAAWKSREVRKDETRMSGYIASLKAIAADHRDRIADLEFSLLGREQMLAAQERLLDGQAAHMRTLDARYVG